MGSSRSKAIVYLIISAVVIILIKLWLHYTSWLPIATLRAEKQARAVCKEYVLTCESVEINELIIGEPYAYLTVKVSDAEKLALHRPSKKTRRRSSQKENYEYEDVDDFYYDHMDEYENYDDAQDDWG